MALNKKHIAVALAIAVMMMIASVLAYMTSTKTITSSGTINAFKVGVYSDSGFSTPLSSITFDTISPGYSTVKTIFIRNDATSGGKSMSLSMSIPSWSCTPLNTTFNVALFSFNATGVTLAPTVGCAANITLSAPDNSETKAGLSFTNLDINIIGTEV